MDKRVFLMKLSEIQPSQLYICSEKLSEVMKAFDVNKLESIKPIPIRKLGDDIIFVDGHTRAFAAFLHGFSEVPACWENEDLDWEAYKICVEWCRCEGIRTIADLKNRVIPQSEYEILWYERCEKMQQELEAKKKEMKRVSQS
ncbi:MAG: ParB/Srx family N-terminal domain-containing protein [Candidatus Bathyarchaeia archaeon]